MLPDLFRFLKNQESKYK